MRTEILNQKLHTKNIDKMQFRIGILVTMLLSINAFAQNGLSETFYPNGNTEYSCNYKNGKKHGRATNWHRSGQITWERHFKEDQLDGDSICYDTVGNITQHVIYKMGRIEKAIK